MWMIHAKCEQCWDAIPCSCPAQMERNMGELNRGIVDFIRATENATKATIALAVAFLSESRRCLYDEAIGRGETELDALNEALGYAGAKRSDR